MEAGLTSLPRSARIVLRARSMLRFNGEMLPLRLPATERRRKLTPWRLNLLRSTEYVPRRPHRVGSGQPLHIRANSHPLAAPPNPSFLRLDLLARRTRHKSKHRRCCKPPRGRPQARGKHVQAQPSQPSLLLFSSSLPDWLLHHRVGREGLEAQPSVLRPRFQKTTPQPISWRTLHQLTYLRATYSTPRCVCRH
ncbi:hypothetical protein BDY21DRAFT_10635 [Lineolata rhizophorae]|uniref:Uncharacterized protein n=1 Tax=Lineolata rhizophorae TaxID=578093 RepID=A0A6A6PEK2_9PEZI|nr:hypothetical protein BDY21DRAFT_10635 [Lineolata rhizophorae]